MTINIDDVVNALQRIGRGEEISFDDVQSLQWEAPAQLDPIVQRVYRELQIFASDKDVREKDPEYDRSWRIASAKLLDELQQASQKISSS